MKKMLYENSVIELMMDHNFRAPFDLYSLDALRDYMNKNKYDLEFKFLNDDLDLFKTELDYNIRELYFLLAYNTFELEVRPDFKSVPAEWEIEQPERFKETVNKANHHAAEIAIIYNDIVRLARKRMLEL